MSKTNCLYRIRMECLFGNRVCHYPRYKGRPLWKRHYLLLMNRMSHDLSQSGRTPVDAIAYCLDQEGGDILGTVARLASAHSGKIGQAVSARGDVLKTAIDNAQMLSQSASQVSNQVEEITSQIGSLSGSFDSNYSQNQLTVNSPLGSQGNFQSFGDYVCIKKTFLEDLRTLLFELLAKRDG